MMISRRPLLAILNQLEGIGTVRSYRLWQTGDVLDFCSTWNQLSYINNFPRDDQLAGSTPASTPGTVSSRAIRLATSLALRFRNEGTSLAYILWPRMVLL